MVQNFCPSCGDPLPEHARFCKGCQSLVSATSPCISCGGLIPREVEKCTHCDSYQNWRRWFTVSSTMLAVATALVSVVGLTINTCATVATPRSSTTATITGATQENLLIAVINSGNAPSVVRNFTFTVDGDVLKLDRIWTSKEDEPKHFLKGRDSAVLYFFVGSIKRAASAKTGPFWETYGNTPIHLDGTAVESDGTKKSLRDEATLNDIRLLVEDKCPDCKDP
jgi:predicted nucleic acid-binding Zn ribbon protein